LEAYLGGDEGKELYSFLTPMHANEFVSDVTLLRNWDCAMLMQARMARIKSSDGLTLRDP
jgi:hypothetical protein